MAVIETTHNKHTATISGKSMFFDSHLVKAADLMKKIHPLMGWGNPKIYHKVGDVYYLPRQNKPNGITGDGNYVFDLRECSDFVMVAITPSHRRSDYRRLNLYGRESDQRA